MKMTTGLLSKASLLALAAFVLTPCAEAQLTVIAPGYSVNTYYTHTTSDDVISFDWDSSSNLYYMTGPNDFSSGTGFWKTTGGAPTNLYTDPNTFTGGSVVTIGNYAYFNNSDFSNNQFIRSYGPLPGSPTLSIASTTFNSTLLGYGGNMFIAGADNSNVNHIYYSQIAANGSLLSSPAISLGTTPGASGPMAFDAAGDLYYAPGFSDKKIYKWSAAEVSGAIADPTNHGLDTTGHLWLNYAALFPTVSGATSLLLESDGDLLVTLTDFTSPSDLVEFGTNPDGTYSGVGTTLLTDSGRIEELREKNGVIYLSTDNQIVQVVPEPGSGLLVGMGVVAMLGRRQRKS